MKKLTKKVRINRARWRTGHNGPNATGRGETLLLNPEGYMCCLGFAAKQLGKIPNARVMDSGEPDDLKCVITPLTKRKSSGFICNTEFSNKCVRVNDDSSLTRKQRERNLIRKFNAEGIELEFFGNYKEFDHDESE